MSAAVSFSDKKGCYSVGPMSNRYDGILHLSRALPIIQKIIHATRGKMPEWHRLELGEGEVLFCRGVTIYKPMRLDTVMFKELDLAELVVELKVQMTTHAYFTKPVLSSEVNYSFKVRRELKIEEGEHSLKHYLDVFIEDPTSGATQVSYDLRYPQVFLEIHKGHIEKEDIEVLGSHIYSEASMKEWFPFFKKHCPSYVERIYMHLSVAKSGIIDGLKHSDRYEKKFEIDVFNSAYLVLEKKVDSVYGYVVIVGPKTEIFDFQSKKFFNGALVKSPEKFKALLDIHHSCSSANIFKPNYPITLESGEVFYTFDEVYPQRLDQKLQGLHYLDFDQVVLECLKTVCVFGSKGYDVQDMFLSNIYFYPAGPSKIGSVKIFIKSIQATLDYRKAIRGVIGIAYNLYILAAYHRSKTLCLPEVVNKIGFVESVREEISKHETLWTSLTSAAGAASGGAGIVSVSSTSSFLFKDKEGFRIKILKELIDIHQKLDALFLDPLTFDKKLFKAEDFMKALKGDSTVPAHIKYLKTEYERVFNLLSLFKKDC